jgi:hypothetical protein
MVDGGVVLPGASSAQSQFATAVTFWNFAVCASEDRQC